AGRCNSASYAAFLLDVLSQTTQPVVVIQDGARYHTSKAMQASFETHAERLTIEQLPAYSPDFNPIEHLWKKVKKEATHLKYFPEFTSSQTCNTKWTGPCSILPTPPLKSRCSWPATVRSSGKWTKQHRSCTKLSLNVYSHNCIPPRKLRRDIQ